MLNAHPWCEDETHVDTRVLWECCQHGESVQVAAILDPVAFGDGVAGMANLLQHLNITVHVAAILDPVALGDGVAGMSTLLQHLNITVQVAVILDPVALSDGVAGMSNLLQHLNITVHCTLYSRVQRF